MNYESRETLATFVRRIMQERDMSTYDVERNARKQISQSHVHRIKAGEVMNLTASKATALAQGLGISEEELFAIIRGKRANLSIVAHEELTQLLCKFDQIEPSKKALAKELIGLLNREFDRLLLEPHK